MQLSTSTLSSLRPTVAIALAGLAVACGGPTVGELAAQEVTLTVSGVASAPEVAAIGKPTSGLGVSRAFVSTTALRFQACDEGAADVALTPRAYELLSDPPPSESITTAVQELCGLRVDIGPAEQGGTDGVPQGATLYAEATDESGASFAFTSEASSSLRFEADAAKSFGSEPLLLGIDVSTWLGGLPLDAETSDETAERFAAQLADAAALFVDANGNGVLDDDEREPLLQSKP